MAAATKHRNRDKPLPVPSTQRTPQQAGVLTLTGEIYQEVTVSPETVVLRPDYTRGQGAEAVVRVENHGTEPIQFRMEATPKGVTCQPSHLSLPAGQGETLTFTCDPWFLAAENVTLYAATTHPFEKRVKLALAVAPPHALRVRPAVFRWGVIGRQDLMRLSPLELSLSGEGLDQFDIEWVETPAFLHCGGKEAKKGQVTLTFAVDSATLGADLNSDIVLHLRPKTQPRGVTLKVPTSGILRDP